MAGLDRNKPTNPEALNITMNKEEIKEILHGMNSKSFTRAINSRPSVKEWLLGQYPHTLNINEALYLLLNDSRVPTCGAGNNLLFNTYNKGYRKTCGTPKCLCRGDSQSEALKLFWAEHPEKYINMKANTVATMIDRYGATNHMKSEKFVEELGEKFEKKYGAKSNIERPEVKAKIIAKTNEKHGVDFPFQSKVVRDKANTTFVENHGHGNDMGYARDAFLKNNNGLNPFQVYKDDIKKHWESKGFSSNKQTHIPQNILDLLNDPLAFKNYVKDKTMYEMVNDLKISDGTIFRKIDLYGYRDLLSSSPKSAMEIEMQAILASHGINYIRGNRSVIAPLEIDFYFPDIKVGVELNGLFWHSDRFKKDDYHTNKHKLAEAKGVTLFQFWEDEWYKKKNIIVSKILHLHDRSKVIVGARKMSMGYLSNYDLESDFLNANHIQGESMDRTTTVCAKYNDAVVAVMAVKIKNGHMDITRYATDGLASYPGLFSRMLNWFVLDTKFKGKIVSFSDNNHSNGNLYKQSGFSIESLVKPSYYVSNGSIRWRRERFRKDNIKKNYPEVYDDQLTEIQMTEALGFFRVWDSGKIKWVKNI